MTRWYLQRDDHGSWNVTTCERSCWTTLAAGTYEACYAALSLLREY